MSEKLYEKLCRYGKEDVVPMHMPGHKRNFGFGNEYDSVYGIDITEIDGFDNLAHPTGIIHQLQQDMAGIYGTEASFMLVNGSSAGVLAAISGAAVRSDNKKIIIARNCHKSVYNAVYLNFLEAVYITPELDGEMGIWGRINPCKLEELIDRNPDICAVVITSPTYEGIVSDIEKISEITHKNRIPLIVDSAHGAHFKFSCDFPITAIEAGADIVIESLHKTLPALTQTAVLHVSKNSLIDCENIKRFVDIYQSTSPSYILMASISKCMEFVQEKQDEFHVFTRRLKLFRKEVGKLNNIHLYPVDDLSKIIIYSPYLKGPEIYDILLKKYGIQLEMASLKYVIAMATVCDSQRNFDRFLEALRDIDKDFKPNKKYIDFIPFKSEKLEAAMNFREAFSCEKISILLEEAVGKISHEHIIAYPPGCPVVAAGEIFSENAVDTIKNYLEMGIEIIGVENGMVSVVR
ncbi:MAG: aminotransferase class I/II-fold pyridoxal phosphate-dependent enzyme [Lachnospiraceae bacterium]